MVRRLPVLTDICGTVAVKRPSFGFYGCCFRSDKSEAAYIFFLKYKVPETSNVNYYIDSQGSIMGIDHVVTSLDSFHGGIFTSPDESLTFENEGFPPGQILIVKPSRDSPFINNGKRNSTQILDPGINAVSEYETPWMLQSLHNLNI